MFHKILIANRGEIACRIARTAHALGYRTVAVFSDADRDALHARAADEAVPIGSTTPAQSYLSREAILSAARRSGADAVHPGYGFLSENADFAEACAEAGLVFIGPPPEAIRLMGNKAAAKRRMARAGVPCVPGYEGEAQDDATLRREAERIGFPVMVKAAAGGGGRGMRLVESEAALADALASARSEASGAFGSDELILERAIVRPRHVEIQVFADSHGNTIHLGERDCSIQRRHQKVIEEAPSPAVTPELRARMGEAAVAAARAIGYVGAGTIEFLLAADGAFYFMEMNTRLQVEHPVTELVTGQDLVAWQIDVADGGRLPLTQEAVALEGHAMEARLYAEDPYEGFLPQSGRVALWDPPAGPGVRVDHGLRAGQGVTPFYDPMLAKVIAHGRTREEARRRLVRALDACVAAPLATNRAFLGACLRHPAFVAGEATTGFIPDHFPAAALRRPAPPREAAALAAVLLCRAAAGNSPPLLRDWRSNGPAGVPLLLASEDGRAPVEVVAEPGGRYRVSLPNGGSCAVAIVATEGDRVRYEVDGKQAEARALHEGGTLYLQIGGFDARYADLKLAPPEGAGGESDGRVTAALNGTVRAVFVQQGERVGRGQRLLMLEAMKMEMEVASPAAGRVARVAVSAGAQVGRRDLLVELEPDGREAGSGAA